MSKMEENGTYRLKIKSVDEARVAHGTFVDKAGDEVQMFIPVGHLEAQMGKKSFRAGQQFNMTVSENGRNREYVEII